MKNYLEKFNRLSLTDKTVLSLLLSITTETLLVSVLNLNFSIKRLLLFVFLFLSILSPDIGKLLLWPSSFLLVITFILRVLNLINQSQKLAEVVFSLLFITVISYAADILYKEKIKD